MSKEKVKIKQELETAQVIANLKEITQSLENGILRTEDDDNSIEVAVAESMTYKLKMTRENGEIKCRLKLEWQEPDTKAKPVKDDNK